MYRLKCYFKKVHILLLIVIFFSCKNKKEVEKDKKGNKVILEELQSIIDKANVNGSILIYDFQNKKWYSNDFEWTKKGKLPASTFKIANSIIGLETGIIKNDSMFFKWNGEKRRLKVWEQDLTFNKAFHYSCVPCYQDIARKIGVKKMNNYLKKLNYGLMKVDSTSIDNFWLQGASKINQQQQIAFLKRFYTSELPITRRTEKIMKELMVVEENKDFKISGKTGWSIKNDHNNGWFVGYIETKKGVHFFATNIEPKEDFNMKMFPMIRKDISYKAFKEIGIVASDN